MARRRKPRRPVEGIEKANVPGMGALPSGTVAVSASALIQALQQGTSQTGTAEPLPRDSSWAVVPFAPGLPAVPLPINQPRPDTGRAEPRRFDYPVSWNLPGAGNQRLLPWKVLRDAADQVDLIRRCIEVRKAEIIGLGADVVISDEAIEEARRADKSKSDAQIADELRDDLSGEIARLRTWWEVPDRTNGWDFNTWLGALVEEHLVLDALSIYPRLTYGGDLYSLEILDGSTIKPLLDERGNTPQPPQPAYQQMLYGFPRGEFTADAILSPDGEPIIPDGFARDQLLYLPRTVRTWTPYGYSPVEQALVSADLWLKRQSWMRAEYTDGTLPASFIKSDASLTPEQLRHYEVVLNDQLAGQTGERHRFKLLPKGMEPAQQKDAAERYRPDYDEFLVKLVCSHLGVLPSRLGFTPKSGLGGKGHQDGEEDSEERLSTRPLTEWLAGILNRISRQYLGMDRQLTWRFHSLDAEDENAADETAERQFKSGRITLNEDRDRLGKPRFNFPEADVPMIVTTTGVVFLDGEMEAQEAAKDAEIKAAQPVKGGEAAPGAAPGGPGAPNQPSGTVPPKTAGSAAQAVAQPSAAKADEIRALRKFAARNPSREFVCAVLTKADLDVAVADGILPAAAAGLAKAADASAHPDARPLVGVGGPRHDHRRVRAAARSGHRWDPPEAS